MKKTTTMTLVDTYLMKHQKNFRDKHVKKNEEQETL